MSKESNLINSISEIIQLRYGFNNSEIHIAPHVTINDEIIKPDIIVYQKVNDRESPAVVIEVKKLIHPLHQEQLFNYMRMLGTQYGIISDGSNFVFYKQISENNFIEIPDIPFRARGAIPFKKSSLNIPTNLHYKLTKIAWMISENLRRYYAPDPYRVILALQKILLCKIIDEGSHDSESILYAIPFMVGHKNGDPVEMMNLLFKKVKYLYSDLFNSNESLDLDREVILKAIEELQSYSITRTDKKTLRDTYENVICTLISNPYLQRYALPISAPKPIVDFIVKLLDPSITDKILDPFVDFGKFLFSCLRYIGNSPTNNIQAHTKDIGYTQDYPVKSLYGIERNSHIASITKAGMIITGDDNRCEIILSDPFIYAEKFQNGVNKFDVILAIPPFSSRIRSEKLYQDRLLYSGNYEDFLAVELSLKLLNENRGRIALVLRESFLFSKEVTRLRNYLLERKLLKGVISLPMGIFPISKALKTSILVLDNRFQKRTDTGEYKIFMAEISNTSPSKSNGITDLDTIESTYKEFVSGKIIDTILNPNIFLVNASDLKTENWSIQANIPVIWEKNLGLRSFKLEEIVEIIRGASVTSPSALKYNKHNIFRDTDSKRKIPYVRISDIANGKISRELIRFIDQDQIKNADRYKIKNNDILLSIRGTIGKIGIVDQNFDNMIASSQIAILRIKLEEVDPVYLYYALSSGHVQEQIQRYKTGAIISIISLTNLKKLQIPLPTSAEQKKIIEKIKILEKNYELAFNYSRKDLPERINKIIIESKDDR